MKKFIVILVLLYLTIYILPLGVRPLITPDEIRYAEIPREMIDSGDWVIPRFNGLCYFEKPVLGYWLNGIAMILFGQNAFSVRLPSALGAGISALLIFILAKKFTGSNKQAIFSSAIFLTCQEIYFVGTFSVLDTVLTTFITAALTFFFIAIDEKNMLKKICFLAIFGASCGCAFLVKGFLAFVIPIAVITPFMFWQKRWKELFYLPWIPIIAVVLVSLPWAIMAHLNDADYWRYFFWEEHIERFLSPDGPKHPQPFFFFVPVLLVGAIPWTFLFPSFFFGMKEKGFSSLPFIKYLLCWFVFPFLFFSISKGKLATYILPCFVPLSILLSIGLIEYFKCGWKKSFNIGVWTFALILALVSAALAIAHIFSIPYGSGETFKWSMALTALLVWCGGLVYSAQTQDINKKIIYFCAAPLLFMFISPFIIPDINLRKKAPADFFEKNAHTVKKDSILVAYPSLVGAASWYLKRDDIYVLHKGGELEYGLQRENSKYRYLSFKDFEVFIKENKNVILIMEHRDKREEYVPQGKKEYVEGEKYFIEF